MWPLNPSFAPYGIVLAAGEGRRLRPLTETTPKPLIKIHGISLIDHPVRTLKQFGFEHAVINTHYLPDQIANHFKNDPFVLLSHEPKLLETGGGIIQIIKTYPTIFKDRPFLCVNSDEWFQKGEASWNKSVQKLMETWDEDKMDILLLIVSEERAPFMGRQADYGMDEAGKLHHHQSHFQRQGFYAGLQILHPRIFESYLQKETIEPFSLKSLYDLSETKGRLYGAWMDEDQWSDISTPETFQKIHDLKP